jgi:cation diffusion facilitator family transporter
MVAASTPQTQERCENAGALPPSAAANENRMRAVVLVAAGTMVLELVVGFLSGSLALTVDGVHMATHVGALGLSALAYWFARTRARHAAFSFGTGKVNALAGFSSGLLLLVTAAWMAIESLERLFAPRSIDFMEALPVAVFGLLVNLGSAKLLHGGIAPAHPAASDHGHDHDHSHDHAHGDAHNHVHNHDHNLNAAYMHVVADALTSLLAIVALVLGMWLGWTFLDPVTGIVGGLIVGHWSIGLLRTSGRVLVDATTSPETESLLRSKLEAIDGVRVCDLHLWEAGPGERYGMVTLEAESPREANAYREILLAHVKLDHLTIEVRPRRR